MRLRDVLTFPGSERCARLCARIAGADWETLQPCRQHDRDNVRAVAEIMLFT
jgi:hypothetical protein